MEDIIEVKNLTKAFSNKVVLKDVNFSVKKGETFGFLGPSGSGKTTTIKILTSQLLHTKGDVHIFNKPIQKQNKHDYMKKIGVLTDNSTLYERLTVYDNLLLYCKLYNVDKKRINEVLSDVNLLNEQKVIIQRLSKGMKQRVTLARALLHKPAILFLDEPTSALDPVNSKHIYKGLKKLNEEGTTIFLTTHDMHEAEEICDRVAFLHNGEIKLLDTPQNLRCQYSEGFISLVLKSGEVLTIKNDEQGADKISDYIKKRELVSIHSNEPSLGDIFVRLTGSEL
ncbi:ABC transporter ATP-binding protein [Priestia megaterium]|uniref:ABC transporter ATP-binding protein n=1 Tax=Priestia megaterium TaxID=1404 RepID=UPI000BF4CB7A|nr:ABC transporter ATP-binding protein [Priestia megaterium]AUO14646.1 ABC transporter ATP-binding protein [Priestia megaterium]MCM3155425.1 ABC transporter ATP-binding protein [Priestia megaterium]MDC7724367.1 ABC transporter ATP-binding protein [Priestia megaterium]PEU67558.1 bacitracin ABC transporter ATP-binding protein [Priestia megaterium]PFJ96597.1 bacitracin ABC transporter ATP-binding protein [Priestia megaterium]